MCSGGGSAPKVTRAPTPPPIAAPMEADTTAVAASDLERRRRQAASGRSDTILTGAFGDSSRVQVGRSQVLGG